MIILSSSLVVYSYFCNNPNQSLAQPSPQTSSSAIMTINPDACSENSQNPISPRSVSIPVGGTVNWINNDSTGHEFVSGTPNALTNIFDSGYIVTGKPSVVITFKNPGTFKYFDQSCPNLTGTINVVTKQISQQQPTPQLASKRSSITNPPQSLPINNTNISTVTPKPLPNNISKSHTRTTSTSPQALLSPQSKPLPKLPVLPSLPLPSSSLTIMPKQQQRQQLPSQPIIRQFVSPQQHSRPSLQQQVPAGFMAKGTIHSLIYAPTTKWIATGNWSMNINNGSLRSFNTNMIWFNNNGTSTHTHEFLNFKPTGGRIITIQQPSKDVILKGVMDVGTNHRISWINVPTTININGEKTISISVDDKATNKHFAAQPVYGVVTSLTPCSDIPGPNMEILPRCSN